MSVRKCAIHTHSDLALFNWCEFGIYVETSPIISFNYYHYYNSTCLNETNKINTTINSREMDAIRCAERVETFIAHRELFTRD